MGRSRSRSPGGRKEKRRSRSRDRGDRDREYRRRHRSRSRSPHGGHRSRSRSPHRRRRSGSRDNDVVFVGTSKGPAPRTSGSGRSKRKKRGGASQEAVVTIDDDMDTGENSMMQMMGFSDFNSTKGKHVEGNDTYAANIVQKRKYRQYMNRRGGFNRPLDFVA